MENATAKLSGITSQRVTEKQRLKRISLFCVKYLHTYTGKFFAELPQCSLIQEKMVKLFGVICM